MHFATPVVAIWWGSLLTVPPCSALETLVPWPLNRSWRARLYCSRPLLGLMFLILKLTKPILIDWSILLLVLSPPLGGLTSRTSRPPNVLRRSEEHTSELQSRGHLVCRLLLEKKKTTV